MCVIRARRSIDPWPALPHPSPFSARRRAGLHGRTVAARMVAFIVLLYSFYAVTVAAVGIGLWTGVLPGGGSPLLTVVPAVASVVVIGGALLASRLALRFNLTGKSARV